MEILLTHLAADLYPDLIRASAPGATWSVMASDGSVTRDGGHVDWAEATPEVAWINAEIFDSDMVRPFFGFLMRSQTLRWIQSAAAGVDHPVFGELAGRGTTLTNAHVGDINISEYVLGQVLAHRLGLHEWRAAQQRREWAPHTFRELHGARWLVIGLGAIGAAVARRAGAFGCSVTGVRRQPSGDEPVDRMIGPGDVMAVLPQSDVVVLAAPATDATRHMVDDAFLAEMSTDAVLVNIARGALVDEAALLRSLDAGRPEVAILDVTETEPLPPDSPLWSHPRVLLTPHSSGAGDGHYRRGAEIFAENLRRWATGEPLRNVVNP